MRKDTIRVIDSNVVIKEFRSERVVTFKDVDNLHERSEGSAKKSFHNNRDKFIEGVDYFRIPLKEFREKYSPNDIGLRGNPSLEVVLLTELGYLMVVKTFSDDLAWRVQRALVANYFKTKTAVAANNASALGSEFDLLRMMIDHLEESKKLIAENVETIKALTEKVEEIEEKVTVDTPFMLQPGAAQPNLLKAHDIARHLKVFSLQGIPHSRMVGAIAKVLGFKIGVRNFYEDENIVIAREGDAGTFAWQVYYKPAGVDKIVKYFNKNKNKLYYRETYKNDCESGKAGDLKEAGFKIAGVCWAVAS